MGQEDGGICRFSHEAMTTVFEVLIAGQEKDYARQAAMAVFAEIDHLEEQLSRFDARSDVAQLNRLMPGEAIGVSWEVVSCLELAQRLYRETAGAFDVTFRSRPRGAMGELVLCGIGHATVQQPEDGPKLPGFIAGRRPSENGGARNSLEIDLGAIGKGYALDRVVDVLADWGIESALLNAGTSTVLALAAPPGQQGWQVGVGGIWGKSAGKETVLLSHAALSGSGEEVKGTHVIDPRTGKPTDTHQAAWVLCKTSAGTDSEEVAGTAEDFGSAALSDALSTAFMVMTTEEVDVYCAARPAIAAMVVDRNAAEPGSSPRVHMFGHWPE